MLYKCVNKTGYRAFTLLRKGLKRHTFLRNEKKIQWKARPQVRPKRKPFKQVKILSFGGI